MEITLLIQHHKTGEICVIKTNKFFPPVFQLFFNSAYNHLNYFFKTNFIHVYDSVGLFCVDIFESYEYEKIFDWVSSLQTDTELEYSLKELILQRMC